MSRRDRNRTINPRFLLFLASVFILLISVTLLVIAIIYGSSFCSATSCGRSPDSLTLGSTVIDTGTGPTSPPSVTKTENSQKKLIAAPPELDTNKAYMTVPVDAAMPGTLGFTYDIRRNNREETFTSNPLTTAFSFSKGSEYSSVLPAANETKVHNTK